MNPTNDSIREEFRKMSKSFDVMPQTLAEYQEKIYQACVNTADLLEYEASRATREVKREIREKVASLALPRTEISEGNAWQWQDGVNEGIRKVLALSTLDTSEEKQ